MDTNKNYLKNIYIFQCPICKQGFSYTDRQLQCNNKHSFDFSHSGYVNFLCKPVKQSYSKQLFKSRRKVVEENFFSALELHIINIISDLYKDKDDIVILDAGCGEGGVFSNILSALHNKGLRTSSIGIDIAKEGISYASKKFEKTIWLVSDISNIPVKDNSVDIILNTLTPANYLEFYRILKPQGIIVKTVPNKEYLKEFRLLSEKTDYTNQKTISLFRERTDFIKEVVVFEEKSVSNENVMDLFEMTPLSWNQKIDKYELSLLQKLTVSLTILVGRKI